MYIHTYTHVYTCIHIHVDLFEQTLFVYTVVYIYTIEVSKTHSVRAKENVY